MKTTIITKVYPLRAATLCAIFQFALGVLWVIGTYVAAFQAGGKLPADLWKTAVFVPPLYCVAGIVMGGAGAWVYNVLAKKIGGIQVDLLTRN